MPILTANSDNLRYDPLRDDKMGGYDPLDPQSSKRIKTYDKDLGFAMHGEQKDAILQFKDDVGRVAGDQTDALDTYKTDYEKALAGADEKASGIIGQYKNIPVQQKVSVDILNDDGTVEKSYLVNKDWADKELGKVGFELGENGRYGLGRAALRDYSLGSGGVLPLYPGDENSEVTFDGFDDILKNAQEQTSLYDEEIDSANANIGKGRQGTQLEIDSQRRMAGETYDQNVDQAEQIIQQTKAQWTNFLQEQQVAFAKGVQNNTGGIKDLLDSGALVMKGEIA